MSLAYRPAGLAPMRLERMVPSGPMGKIVRVCGAVVGHAHLAAERQ